MPGELVKKLIKNQKKAMKNIENMGLEFLPSVTGPYIFNPNTGRVVISYDNGENKENFNRFCGV